MADTHSTTRFHGRVRTVFTQVVAQPPHPSDLHVSEGDLMKQRKFACFGSGMPMMPSKKQSMGATRKIVIIFCAWAIKAIPEILPAPVSIGLLLEITPAGFVSVPF
jgi:hypothetical protein